MQVYGKAKDESNNEAEQIGKVYPLPDDEQDDYKQPLKQVCPRSLRQYGEHDAQGVPHARNSRYARAGIQHEHYAHGGEKCPYDQEDFPVDRPFFCHLFFSKAAQAVLRISAVPVPRL